MALTEVDVARLNDDVFAATGTNKNRIINGDMRIDQRNAGASITPASTGAFYSVDRWALETTRANALTLQQVTDAPVGFTNSLRVTVASSVASMSAGDAVNLFQGVEGFNIADLGFGTANAQPITLSFWVKSSVTGTYSWFIRGTNDTRCYVGTYSITQANTWEQKIINVQGDSTTFAYNSTNGRGFLFGFALGDGSNFETAGNTWTGVGARMQVTGTLDFISQSNGSTWQVTGVQLEAGDTATPFERRSYGQELSLCQRYFQRWQLGSRDTRFIFERDADSSNFIGTCELNVLMRTFPHTATFRDAANWNVFAGATYTVDSRSLHASAGSGTLTNVNRVGITITSTALANQLGGNWQTIQIRSNSNTLMPSVLFDAEM